MSCCLCASHASIARELFDESAALLYNEHKEGAVGKRPAPELKLEKTPPEVWELEAGLSYAFKTTRMNSVTRSNAIKSLIAISNAPFSDLSKKQAQRVQSIGK